MKNLIGKICICKTAYEEYHVQISIGEEYKIIDYTNSNSKYSYEFIKLSNNINEITLLLEDFNKYFDIYEN